MPQVSKIAKTFFFKKNGQYYGFLLSVAIKLTFTCSKSTIKALEKEVKYVQS